MIETYYECAGCGRERDIRSSHCPRCQAQHLTVLKRRREDPVQDALNQIIQILKSIDQRLSDMEEPKGIECDDGEGQ